MMYFRPMNLYEKYEISKSEKEEDKIKTINEIITQYPKIIDYLYNRIDTCFGKHIVYVVHMRVDGIDMIKIGYSKNSVTGRFSEKRWTDHHKIEIIKIYKENTLQAKGAVDFEKHLKSVCGPYIIDSNVRLPGKNEFMSYSHLEDILNHYDNLFPYYEKIIGLKSPN